MQPPDVPVAEQIIALERRLTELRAAHSEETRFQRNYNDNDGPPSSVIIMPAGTKYSGQDQVHPSVEVAIAGIKSSATSGVHTVSHQPEREEEISSLEIANEAKQQKRRFGQIPQ